MKKILAGILALCAGALLAQSTPPPLPALKDYATLQGLNIPEGFREELTDEDRDILLADFNNSGGVPFDDAGKFVQKPSRTLDLYTPMRGPDTGSGPLNEDIFFLNLENGGPRYILIYHVDSPVTRTFSIWLRENHRLQRKFLSHGDQSCLTVQAEKEVIRFTTCDPIFITQFSFIRSTRTFVGHTLISLESAAISVDGITVLERPQAIEITQAANLKGGLDAVSVSVQPLRRGSRALLMARVAELGLILAPYTDNYDFRRGFAVKYRYGWLSVNFYKNI